VLNSGLNVSLSPEDLAELRVRALRARGTVLTATSVANSGHPGGSFSSMELYMLAFGSARLRPDEPRWIGRDRIVVSHGHTSPGVYAALAEGGFFPAAQVEAHFRQVGSLFEGHVERSVPGVEWSSGNLGQGLSAGVGLALGARLTDADWHTLVVMSDGEQQKGQVGEARRLAVMQGLDNLTALIDLNGIQISGRTCEVLDVPVAAGWAADGWRVHECDGHDIRALHEALRAAASDGVPSVVIAHTVIGKGVSFMEGKPEFHGRALSDDEYASAMGELGLDPARLAQARAERGNACSVAPLEHRTPAVVIDPGEYRTYGVEKTTDNRSAWGSALTGVAEANPSTVIAVTDCDLAVSVKTDGFAGLRPTGFVQCGVGEHNAATVTGALSTVPGVLAFWSDFGVFGIDEVYNQQRLNDINGAALKLVVTHCGLDVGEDGKTHQCLDYVGALRELYGWRVIVPADPNQTDRAVREMAGMEGCVALAVGRSKLPVLMGEDGQPLFGDAYRFAYGEITWARKGARATVLAMGTVAGTALSAVDRLRSQGLDVGLGIVASPLHMDDEALNLAATTSVIVTVEDHNVGTGLGCSVALWLSERKATPRLVRLGVDGYHGSGAASALMAEAGLDVDGIEGSIRAALAEADG
jgi:transketolase